MGNLYVFSVKQIMTNLINISLLGTVNSIIIFCWKVSPTYQSVIIYIFLFIILQCEMQCDTILKTTNIKYH